MFIANSFDVSYWVCKFEILQHEPGSHFTDGRIGREGIPNRHFPSNQSSLCPDKPDQCSRSDSCDLKKPDLVCAS